MTEEENCRTVTEERLKHLPAHPGVYLMKDQAGTVLYIGKAKNLKNRVRSYFAGRDDRYNVQFLLERVQIVDTLVTEDERQAIILESDLIKKYKPRYNIRLKDDKAHFIVRIDMTHEWPKLDLVRRIEDDGARYLGPFPFGYELRTLLEVIKRTVPLRTCSDRVIYNRVRPCLEYQIKRCAGPCCLDVDRAQYLEWIEQAVQILEGRNEEVAARMRNEMLRASDELRFEDAAEIRDRIQILERLSNDRPALQFGEGSRDAFGVFRDGEKLEVSILMVRRGRLFESKTFGFSAVEFSNAEVLPSLLSQYYTENEDVPEEILLPLELEDKEAREELYQDRFKKKVKILFPKIGSRSRLLTLAQRNARENYIARFGAGSGDRALRALENELALEETPRIIECVDVSHFQGGATVASVVVFKDGVPEKTRYRHFHLSQEGKPDDFASMREVVTRHLSRCAEENSISDLLVVDGGPAQLAQALTVRKELGLLGPAMIGLAKKRRARAPYRAVASGRGMQKPERVFVQGRDLPIILNPASEALGLLERIRDEAHRFAISFHRRTRTRRTVQSQLARVPGIGPRRQKELLKEFGSVRAIKQASPAEIAKRCGLGLSLAERVVRILNKPESGGAKD